MRPVLGALATTVGVAALAAACSDSSGPDPYDREPACAADQVTHAKLVNGQWQVTVFTSRAYQEQYVDADGFVRIRTATTCQEYVCVTIGPTGPTTGTEQQAIAQCQVKADQAWYREHPT